MGILSNRVERSELVAGDHIYSWRTAFIYAHHGIYMGDNKVIHFTFPTRAPDPTPSDVIVARCPACEASGWRKHASGESVIISCLDCFIGLGSLYRFEYGVGNLAYTFKLRGGTCTYEESSPVEVVMTRALNLLENGFGEYDLLSHNCEDFARFCKTGKDCSNNGMGADRGSSQASSLMGQIAVSLPLPVAVTLPSVILGSSPGGGDAAIALARSLIKRKRTADDEVMHEDRGSYR